MAKLKIESTAVTPKQWVLIGVLAAALLGALYWPAGEAPADSPAAEAVGSPAMSATMAAAAKRLPARAAIAPKKWPQADLESALGHDPFSSPLLTAKTAPAESDERAEEQGELADLLALKQDGVTMIVRDGGSVAAAVGDRTLRVGDVVVGYRVVAIELDGVRLERVKTD